jgi:MFS family permease
MRSGAVAVAALCLVQFVDVLGVTVVVTALPVMLADLGAPPSSGSLVVTAYAMFFGGLLMLGARLGDRFGHRRTITAGLALFALASLLGALASSIVVLAAARCLQGAAAAASVPSALRLLTTLTAEGPARRRAIAAWSAAGAAAGASGFIIGGIVTDLAGWRVIFWANLPLAVALGAVIFRAVRVIATARQRARWMPPGRSR